MMIPLRPRTVAAAAALFLAAVTAPIASADPLAPVPHRLSSQRAFVLDQESGTLIFGDGTHGQRPPRGSAIAGANYRAGSGQAGNVGGYALVSSRLGCIVVAC